jgi:hypothetical protein
MPESAMSPQDALVAVMVACSASDENMRTAELVAITRMVNHMPIFATYDPDRIQRVSRTVFDLFEEEDGLDALFGLIREALPEHLYETAYALACDVSTLPSRAPHVGGGPRRAEDRPPPRRRHRVGRTGAAYGGVTSPWA